MVTPAQLGDRAPVVLADRSVTAPLPRPITQRLGGAVAWAGLMRRDRPILPIPGRVAEPLRVWPAGTPLPGLPNRLVSWDTPAAEPRADSVAPF